MRLMLLRDTEGGEQLRAVRIPEDIGREEAVRRVTGLIARCQEQADGAELTWDEDIGPLLEDHGFTALELVLGPVWGAAGGA